MTANLNWFDYIILSIFALSILAGLIRGLVKELISVITWFTAIILASLFAEPLAKVVSATPKVSSYISGSQNYTAKSISLLSTSISFMVIFVIVLLLGTFINYFVSRALDAGGISIGNRLLGSVFGLIRGFLINLVIILIVSLSPLIHHSAVQDSQFVKTYRPFIKEIQKWMEHQFEGVKNSVKHHLPDGKVTNFFKELSS